MNRTSDVELLLRDYFADDGLTAPDYVLDVVEGRISRQPQRRKRRLFWRLSMNPLFKLGAAAVVVLVVAVVARQLLPSDGIGGPTFSPSRTPAPAATGPDATRGTVADVFFRPFGYSLPTGSRLVVEESGSSLYSFTEGGVERCPSHPEPVPHPDGNWGIVVAFALSPGSDTVGAFRAGSVLTDMRKNPAISVGPVTGANVAGLSGERAYVDYVTSYEGPAYAALQLDWPDSRHTLRFGCPTVLISAATDDGAFLVQLWAQNPELRDAKLADFDAFTASIEFVP